VFARRSATGALLALAAAGMFGVSGAVAGGVFSTIDPAYVAQVRSLIAAVLLCAFAAYRGTLFPVRGLWKFAVLGVILASVNVTFYWAIDRLGVGPGATIQFLAPTLVLIWIALVRREHVAPIAWVASIAAVGGVALVTQAWSLDASDVAGVASGLAAAVFFAAYLIYGEYLGRDHRPSQVGAWGFVFASIIWAVVLPWWTFPFEAARPIVGDLLVVGILGTALPFMLEFVALTLASSGTVGIVATAEPAIGAVAASIILDQRLAVVQWVGIAVVVVAVAAVQRWGLADAHPTTPIA
jgi:drug/metabolite transporter (DMT)-like permease